MENRTKAFTLVELLSIITILGVMTILVVPQISGSINSKKQKELDKSKSLMSKEAYESIQNNFSAMSFEDVQKEIALTLYKSGANFSVNKENNKKVAVQAHNFSEDFGYGAANALFHN